MFAAVASEVVARLVSRYEKNVRRTKYRILVIFLEFLWIVVDELRLTEKKERKKKKKNKMNIFVAGFLDRTERQVNFEGSFALHKRSSFV